MTETYRMNVVRRRRRRRLRRGGRKAVYLSGVRASIAAIPTSRNGSGIAGVYRSRGNSNSRSSSITSSISLDIGRSHRCEFEPRCATTAVKSWMGVSP